MDNKLASSDSTPEVTLYEPVGDSLLMVRDYPTNIDPSSVIISQSAALHSSTLNAKVDLQLHPRVAPPLELHDELNLAVFATTNFYSPTSMTDTSDRSDAVVAPSELLASTNTLQMEHFGSSSDSC